MGVSLVIIQKIKCPRLHMPMYAYSWLKEGQDPIWWFGGFDPPHFTQMMRCAVARHQTAHMTYVRLALKSIPNINNGVMTI